MPIDINVVSGINGTSARLGGFNATVQEIAQACAQFGSTYILRMGLHYQRYVLSGRLPRWQAVRDIYAGANPAPVMASKRRATSVTGNIGESVLPLVAKQHLGATNPLDILPLNASSTAKSPDFRVRLHPQFPAAFRNVTGLTPNIAFNYWPAESKAVDTRGNANGSVNRAIQQLGAYWFGRQTFEPNVVGYGLVCCFVYRGTRNNPLQEINFHVIAPTSTSAQTALLRRVRHHAANGDRNDFLDELKTDGSQSRRRLLNV